MWGARREVVVHCYDAIQHLLKPALSGTLPQCVVFYGISSESLLVVDASVHAHQTVEGIKYTELMD